MLFATIMVFATIVAWFAAARTFEVYVMEATP